MNVEQLIEQLHLLDPDAPVRLQTRAGQEVELVHVGPFDGNVYLCSAIPEPTTCRFCHRAIRHHNAGHPPGLPDYWVWMDDRAELSFRTVCPQRHPSGPHLPSDAPG